MKTTEKVIYENGNVYVLQAGTPIYVKTADICGITGKSNQWIGQLTSQGTINKERTPYGSMYELADTLESYCEMLEERAKDTDEEDPEDSKIDRAKRAADAKYKQAKAVIASYEAKELSGSMHRSEDVEAMTEDLIFFLRNALMSLPGRVASEVAQGSDKSQASEVIRREVYAIMEEMAQYKYDPKKYRERVRERMNKNAPSDDDE